MIDENDDSQGRGNYKTYWLSGKNGFDKELPDAVISENNHGYEISFPKKSNVRFFVFSLDKELVRLVEEKKARELAEEENKSNVTQIQVKPIIETVSTPNLTSAASASAKTDLNEKIDELLR